MTSVFEFLRGRDDAVVLRTNGTGNLNGEAHELRRLGYVVTSAEQADCTCPDFCERDHENE